MSLTGIEPATFGTGNRCSNPLSYRDPQRVPSDSTSGISIFTLTAILNHGAPGALNAMALRRLVDDDDDQVTGAMDAFDAGELNV